MQTRFFGPLFFLLVVNIFITNIFVGCASIEDDWEVPTRNMADLQKNLKFHASGKASYYAYSFTGLPTANGERFDPKIHTAASKTLPFHSRVLVKDRNSGRFVIVRINDRGPFVEGRIIDLSPAAAKQLGIYNSRGVTSVDVYVIEEPLLKS